MAHRTSLFGDDSTGPRASLNYGHRKADWGFSLVCRSDSRGLPPASTALAGAGETLGSVIPGGIKLRVLNYRRLGSFTCDGQNLAVAKAISVVRNPYLSFQLLDICNAPLQNWTGS